jgi:hypothetical protein
VAALAALRSPPPAEWLGEALGALAGGRPGVAGLDGGGVAALLRALAQLQARVANPAFYDALLGQAAPFLPLLSAQQLADLLGALDSLGHTPEPEWRDRAVKAVMRVTAQAAARPGDPGRAGSRASRAQYETMVLGLCRMGAAPPAALLTRFFDGHVARLPHMPPARVAAAASALAAAAAAPPDAWLNALAGAVRGGYQHFSLLELDAVARALALFVDQRREAGAPPHGPSGDLLAFLREFVLYG